jgi:PucR C-terminal helix-turn-helix domain/Purine catabolism regulatory protein-like family/GGDEF-like domain
VSHGASDPARVRASDRSSDRPQTVTVRRLAADPTLRLRLVAGLAHGGTRVRSAHTIDLDSPGRYVLPAELVLTNGLWVPRIPVATWVAEVAAAGGAGILFGLGPEHPQLPEGLAEACERHRMPLLCAPADISFALLSEHVAALGQPAPQDGLRQQVLRARQLAEGIAAGGGYPALLDLLRRHAGLSGAIVGPGGRVLARTGRPLPARVLTAAVREALRGSLPRSIDETAAAFCAPGRRARSVLVVASPMHVLDHSTLLLIEQLVVYAALEDARGDVERDVRGQLAAELLGRIRRGQAGDADFAIRVETLGMDPASGLRALACASAGDPRVLVHAAESLSRPYALTRVGDDWIVLLDRARDDDAVTLAAGIRGGGGEPVLGWGSRGIGVEGLRRSVAEATACLARAKLRPEHDRLVGPLDVASRSLLLAQLDTAVTRSFTEQLLDPLLEWDRRQGGRLVDTLRTFLSQGGRWTETALALHIHPNTLRYRLARVEELTGRSLTETGDRVDLFLALELLGPPS